MVLGQIFAYIKKHPISRILFDPINPDFSNKGVVETYWSVFCQGLTEPIPPSYYDRWVRAQKLSIFVEASHATNAVT